MTRDPDGQGGPHVLVDDVERPELSDADRHHVERVLRMRPGDPLTLGDGRGRWRTGEMGTELTALGEVQEVAANDVLLTVGFALVKGARPELVVQKLTELGIDRIVVFGAERSVVRWDENKVAAQRDRLGRVVREATMQCRRSWLPELEILAELSEVVARPATAMADFDGDVVTRSHQCVLVGPEGGWTDGERGLARSRVRLGHHVQRAETASISAGVLLSAAHSR